jgi:hypothetical protein
MVGVGDARDLFIGLGAYADSANDYYRSVFAYNMSLSALSKAIGVEITDLEYNRPTSALSNLGPGTGARVPELAGLVQAGNGD